MSGGKRAMVVSPLELSQAGRMNATSRLLGRVVGIEVTDLLFSCYILCGPTRKHLVQVEAWRELLVPATKLFEEGKLVSITKATLAVRRSDKNKFTLSGCRWMIRFDKLMEVQSADCDKAEPVPDWPGKTATDIPHRPPSSTLEMTACLPECAVTVVARVVEIRQKENKEQPDKSFVKAVLQDCNENGEVYQADLMAWQPEFRETMRAALQPDGVYEISPVLVSSEQQSFSVKWIKKTKARSLHGTAEARMLENQKSTAARAIQNLSEQKKTGVGRPDPSTRSAKLVAASTLAEFIPEKGLLKTTPDDVWELPCSMILDITASGGDLWTYVGCSVCHKRDAACSHGGATRPCYSGLLHVSDHTATVEVKFWTEQIDQLMQASGWQEPITDMDAADRFVAVLRTKYWMTRCTIVEEPAFQSRAARNRLQLVHVEERKSDFVGTNKPLFSLRSPNSRPGVPAILFREVQVDAAGQVLGRDGRELHFAEFLVQLRGEPMQDGKDTDKGVRISFHCEDIGDLQSTHSELFWVLSMQDMLKVARLQSDSLLRVVAQPQTQGRQVARWQVFLFAAISKHDIDPWRQRKAWQRSSPGDEKKKRAAEQIALATPNSKLTKVGKELTSPGYDVSPIRGRK